jgi:peptidoglycan/LPS O-acetylase OafA/YrhL
MPIKQSEPRERGASGESRIPSLDGLRAISIALVLFAHTGGTRFFPSFVGPRRVLGHFGVRIFFVISGFLITTLLLKELEKTGRISLKWFYIRRFFRIFPAAYTYLLVMCVLTAAGVTGLTRADLAHAFTYTVNYEHVRPWLTIHLWSLSIEEQFYMLWPAVLFFSGRKTGLRIAAVALFAAPLIGWATQRWVPSLAWSVGTSFQTNADMLAAGCLLAGIRDRLIGFGWYRAFLESRLFLAVPALIVAMVAGVAIPLLPSLLAAPLLNLSIAVFIDRSVRYPSDAFGRFLNWKPVAFVGVLSYSLYLWQEPFLNRLSDHPLCWFPVNLLCAGAAALASYYFIEKPFLGLRRRVEQRAGKVVVAAAAAAR